MRKLSLWLRGDAQVSELEFMRSVVEQEEHTSSRGSLRLSRLHNRVIIYHAVHSAACKPLQLTPCNPRLEGHTLSSHLGDPCDTLIEPGSVSHLQRPPASLTRRTSSSS